MYPELKVVQPVNENSYKKINQESFRLNVHEYYLREGKNANAFAKGAAANATTAAAAAAGDAKDRGHGITMRNTVANVNTKPTKAFDNVNSKYDESALSRCALLFVGSLCQQGKIELPSHNFLCFIFFRIYLDVHGDLKCDSRRNLSTFRTKFKQFFLDKPYVVHTNLIAVKKCKVFFWRAVGRKSCHLLSECMKIYRAHSRPILPCARIIFTPLHSH